MATLIVGSICQARVLCSLNNQLSINVLHYLTTSATGVPTDADLAVALESAVQAPYKALITNGATFRGVDVRVINTVPLPVEEVSNAHAGAGTGGANAAPTQICGLISWRTAVAGRKGRGRTYLPFPDTSDITAAGLPTAAYLLLVAAARNAIIGPIATTNGANTSNNVLVLYNKKTATTTLVTNALDPTGFATQRRRGVFGRTNTFPF